MPMVLSSPLSCILDYDGEIKLMLHNTTKGAAILRKGDRVAQALLLHSPLNEQTMVNGPMNLISVVVNGEPGSVPQEQRRGGLGSTGR